MAWLLTSPPSTATGRLMWHWPQEVWQLAQRLSNIACSWAEGWAIPVRAAKSVKYPFCVPWRLAAWLVTMPW